jgi:hypothetical protein
MKKSTILFVALLATVVFANAQKNDIRVKKGKIIKKETPIAAIVGKGGMLKPHDLTVTSLTTNKPLIRIKEGYYDLKSPLYIPGTYYHITFYNTANIEMDYCLDPAQYKLYEIDIATILFSDTMRINLLENDSTLSETGIQQFVKKYHTDLKADSASKMKYLKVISDAMEGRAARRMDQPLVIKMTNKRENFYNVNFRMCNEYEYEIIQDAVVLGTIKTTITNETTGNSSRMVVKKAVIKPFEWNGAKQFFADAAVMTWDGSFGNFRTFYDNRKYDIPPANGKTGEYAIANFLISKGYL